jgi:hypothetical protein
VHLYLRLLEQVAQAVVVAVKCRQQARQVHLDKATQVVTEILTARIILAAVVAVALALLAVLVLRLLAVTVAMV